ncbi:MAG: hypothetical protein EXX96DRAFT_595072 [Benjaminiella poitrasii]|nr:MAG: hypothetical protein EXX96DRAFT_595072 [Benjaminiella poitrasii]
MNINNVKYKENISSAIIELESTTPNSVNSTKILLKLEDYVIEELNQLSGEAEFDIDNFKNVWSRRITIALKDLDLYTCKKRIFKKVWSKILENNATTAAVSTISTARRSSKNPTSSLSYLQSLDTKDRAEFDKIHNLISNKWMLKSGRYVEDLMYEKIKNFKYEHLGHSFVLDVTDDMWKDVFEKDEIEEIEEAADSEEFCSELPGRLMETLQRLNGKITFQEIYRELNDVKVDRYDDPELYWIKNSILDDSGNAASSEAKNKKRKIDGEALPRQKAGDAYDLVFKHLSSEIGCVEIGLYDKGPNGTKELQEKGIKMPRMMKAFCCRLLEQYPTAEANKIKTAVFIINGKLEHSIKRKHDINEIPSFLPPVLSLVYNCAQIMRRTSQHMETVSSMSRPYFPPCYVFHDN